MKGLRRKVRGLMCVLIAAMALLLGSARAEASGAQTGTITFSVERFTIGQGYFVEPVQIPIYAGDTSKDVLDRMLEPTGGYTQKEGSESFYVTALRNADSGTLDIPYYITDMSGYKITNDNNDGNAKYPDLGEFSYTEHSGWMYSVNGVFPNYGMDSYILKDGDVMRVQFTMWGTGADVGDPYNAGQYGLDIPNRDSLTKAIAAFNGRADKEELLEVSFIADAYSHAMETLETIDPGITDQNDLDQAQAYLESAIASKNLQAITLDRDKLSLSYGGEDQLSVGYTPEDCRVDEGVKWTSSDRDCVYVEQDGRIYGDSIGTAIITATLGNFTASCEVTVSEESAEKPLQGISLNQTEVSLRKGKTTALKVSYNPADTTDDKTVTWSSDNEKTATVDANGRITAVAKGEAVITAQVGSFTASCRVTVTEDDPVDPPDITDDDIAAAREVVRLAAILNTNPSPTLDEVKVVEDAYHNLTSVQQSVLTPEQDANIQLAINGGYSKVLAVTADACESAVEAVQTAIDSGGKPDDQSLFDLVQAEKALNAVGQYEDFLTQDQEIYDQAEKKMKKVTDTLKDVNASDNGVMVKGRSLTLPWTVKVEAQKAEVTSEQQTALENDAQYLDPAIESQYEIKLKDFGAAESADAIPEYDTQGKTFKIAIPSENYTPPTLGEHEQLTLLHNGERIGFEDEKGNALITYDAQNKNFSFSTGSFSTFTVVSDHRIAIERFTLTDTEKTLLLDIANPSFELSVLSFTPYNTTDKSRLTYTSSDPSVASVDDKGIVTGHIKGTAVITAEVCGIKNQCTVTVKMNRYVDFESYWPTFRKNNSNMAIVDASLPNAGNNLTEKWINSDINVGGKQMTAGTPLVVDNYVFVSTQNNKLYKLDKNTGAIVKEAKLAMKVGFFSYATYGDGMIFVPEEDGTIEAFNADTLDSLWRTESFGGQSNCQVTYADGFIYSGTWSGSTNKGKFFCVDTTSNGDIYQTNGIRRAKWVSDDDSGYYWSGATVVGNAVIFGGDSGVLQSRNKSTGALIDRYATGGVIRSSIAYDAGTNALYFTAGGGVTSNGITGGGKCYKIGVTSDGHYTGAKIADLPAASTTSPVVYNGRVYVTTQKVNGSGHEEDYNKSTVIDQSNTENGKLAVLDADSLRTIYQTDIGGPSKASPLLTTAYTADGQQTVYLYITVNNHDGAIVRVKDWAGNTTPQAEVIYRADGDEQEYTTSSLNCDADGTIYYRNDRGHLMALTGTSEGVREAAAVEGRLGVQKGNKEGSDGMTARASGKTAGQAEDEFKPWDFDGAMLPYSKSVSKTPSGTEQLKKAAVVLSCTAVAMAVLYITGCGLWPKLVKKP
ncbi:MULTISPECIES: Ig-like domain-containing protein [Eubacterium]|uniref:Ig-like domain-containing protein n=1 Tax=Eubacterium TaxID=1730 RepID=UPI0011C21EC6|nr:MULTISPECIES: Ig-like domain-containing protein [Eubacterium]